MYLASYMSCVLRIAGENFDVDSFVRETRLEVYTTYKKGEPRYPVSEKLNDKNGCGISVSDADFDNFSQQKIDTIEYLQTNFEKLQMLKDYGLNEDEEPYLDFGIETRMDYLAVQGDYFPPVLLKLTGDLNIGIMLTQYWVTNNQEETKTVEE